jgi:type I restriction-modification system DNA methylase subunit
MKNDFFDTLGFTTEFGLVHDLGEAKNHVERLYIEEAKHLSTPAHAVYFRRFYKNDEDKTPSSSTPAVCIFQKSDGFFNTDAHKTLHAELWSAGKIEMYIILGETRVDIMNARKPAKRDGEDVTLNHKDLALAREAIQNFEDSRFSAHLFGSGTIWEQSDFQNKIDGNSNPYSFLLDYLMDVRTQLLRDDSIMDIKAVTIDKLLITSILIKFLEEIKNDDGKHTLKDIYKKHSVQTFEEGLRHGKCLDILTDLAREFNGKIFDTFTKEEKAKISYANLSSIAKFLSAEIDVKTNQIFIWKQYSFKHLPAEVISAIYENFIQAEAERNDEVRKDVVYTPLHLVNLMIDEAMPLEQPELFENQVFKVLDPACGSGVFLVAAYKRMLQWWAINHWKRNKDKEIIYPDKETAKQILEQNIFGVDIEPTAALVSIFGLTTAFLDKLTPKEIWNDLKFKDLSVQNIQGLNFKDWAKPAIDRKERFDLVIGNPPFNDSKQGSFTDKDLKDLFGKKVPDNNLALKFFEAALYFGKKVCMIIPSSGFLYNKSNPSHEYRKAIFTNYTVQKVYDFTHLRESLFIKKNIKGIQSTKKKTGRIPVLALIVQNQPSQNQSIEHIVVKRELLGEQKFHFEIDYYDKHRVRWDWAVDQKKQFIWKTNLLGGGRLFHLVYRLSLLETLQQFLREKEGIKWLYNLGYITNHKNKDRVPAEYITGQKTIKPKSFDEFGNFETITEISDFFVEIRTKELFHNPHIIFQLVVGKYKIPMALVNESLCFNSSFVGISAPKEDNNKLSKIYERLHKNEKTSDLYRAYILANSSKAGVYHETSIVKEDIDNLPYPQDEKYLETSEYESIIINDVLRYNRHLGKAITKKHDGHILHEPITELELQSFGKVYCDVLNEIYAEDGKSWQAGEVLQTPTFISYQFGFGKDGGLQYDFKEDAEKDLNILLDSVKSNSGIHYKRIIRNYEHVNGYDCVYLIKPNARRYWLQSIALRDADDTFMDLKKSGY